MRNTRTESIGKEIFLLKMQVICRPGNFTVFLGKVAQKSCYLRIRLKIRGKMRSDFLRLDNAEFSKIGKFPSVGIQIVMNIFGLPNRKNIQNVVENDKNTKVSELPNFPWLLPSLDGKWRRYRIKKKKKE